MHARLSSLTSIGTWLLLGKTTLKRKRHHFSTTRAFVAHLRLYVWSKAIAVFPAATRQGIGASSCTALKSPTTGCTARCEI